MTKKILIGKITSPFGIKGEVKIISYCETPIQIEKYSLFDENGKAMKLKISNKNKTIVGFTISKDAILIAKIDGVDSRNQSELLRGKEIFIDRSELNQTKDDEFYHVDLIGLDVIDLDSKKLGKVINVGDYGAGSMIEIEFLEVDAKNNLDKIENFSFRNEIFPEINLKKGFIKFSKPEIKIIAKDIAE